MLVSQRLFGRETSGRDVKCLPFSQAIGLVDPVLNLYDELVKFFREFSYRKTVINPAHQILEGAAFNKNDSWASTCFNL